MLSVVYSTKLLRVLSPMHSRPLLSKTERTIGRNLEFSTLVGTRFSVVGIMKKSLFGSVYPEFGKHKNTLSFPSIELWHQLHENDWRLARSKLSNWLAALQSRNFTWAVYERGWNRFRQNLAAGEITSEPKRIAAEREKDVIALNPSLLQSEDGLLNLLVKLIKEYANTVDSLGS